MNGTRRRPLIHWADDPLFIRDPPRPLRGAGVIGLILVAILGGLVLAALGLAAALALHIRRARQQSARPFSRLHQPLAGPVPPLDTDPDGPRSAPLRPIFRAYDDRRT